MRKASVRCAAANDSEEEDGGFLTERVPKRVRSSQPADSANAEEEPPVKKKKEKEFAWMESDDDGDGDDDEAAPSGAGEQTRQDADDEAEATSENLDAVQSFGRMMLLTDSLQEKLTKGALGARDVAAACRALARSKFCDGDLLEELSATLKGMIAGDRLTVEQVTDAIMCLKTLNYYKQNVFSAVIRAFKPKVTTLSADVRNIWLDAMRGLGHEGDLDFMQMLEVPPLPPNHPNFRALRCVFFSRGGCASGESCTYAHSHNAPIALDHGGKEDAWRNRSVIMTHDQKYVFKESDTRGQTAQVVGPTQQLGASSAQGQAMQANQLASLYNAQMRQAFGF